VLAPIVTHLFSYEIWEPSDTTWGVAMICGAALFSLVSALLYRQLNVAPLAYTHLLVALYLLTIGLAYLFEGDTLFIAFATEAAIVRAVSARVSDRGFSIAGNILFGIVFFWLLDRLQFTNVTAWTGQFSGTPFLSGRALADLWAIALASGTAFLGKKTVERSTYLVLAAIAFGGFLVRELDGNWQLFAIVAEMAFLHWYARKRNDIYLEFCGHAFFLFVIVWMIARFLAGASAGIAFLNWNSLTDLFALAAAFVVSLTITSTDIAFGYRLVAHAGLLSLMWRELVGYENGQGYVSIAWGVYAILLLLIGLLMDRRKLQTVALATLFLLVGKLFLVDLANLEAIWRILLFLGFGGLFLFISYYFRSLWRDKDKPGREEPAA
jgi:hypothetical protein